jgi:ubiquinone/menaquinone biosynthesis C-methylase UbiE
MDQREENLQLQIGKYQSFEKDYPEYSGGQIRTMDHLMSNFPTDKSVIDVGCGDGVALDWFKAKGFTDVEGIDGNPRKLEIAKKSGFKTYEGNIHEISTIVNRKYDIIYCSHVLEHMIEPGVVLDEFKKILNENGTMFIIVPYPDRGPDDAHCGKYYLHTENKSSDEIEIVNVFNRHGFEVISKEVANIREVEIYLILKHGQ